MSHHTHGFRARPGIYLCGISASVVTALTGGWLMVAPFALGYQPSSAGWNSATGNSFWFGLAIVLVSLIGGGLFTATLVRQTRRADAPGARQVIAATSASATNAAELQRTLAALATALSADLAARGKPEFSPTGNSVGQDAQSVGSGR